MSDTYPDLLAAIVAWFRGNAELVAAFDEDTTEPAKTKFWADHAEGSPSLPYAVLEEVDEVLEYETPGEDNAAGVNAEGHIELHIVASSKLQARQLGGKASVAIWDAPLAFEGGELVQLRPTGQWFMDSPAVSVGEPVEYHRVIEFRYMISSRS